MWVPDLGQAYKNAARMEEDERRKVNMKRNKAEKN